MNPGPEGDDEQLGHPTSPVRGRTLAIVGIAVVVLLAAGVVLRLSQRHGPAAGPAASAVASPAAAGGSGRSSGAATVAVMPVPAADALLPGSGDGDEMAGERITYFARLINGSAATLTLSGPIRLLGPGGVPVPHLSAELVAGWGYQPGLALPPALTEVAPHQRVTLVMSGSRDCGQDPGEASWPSRYPTVVIALAGFTAPWSEGFGTAFAGTAGVNWLDGACRGAG